MNQTEIRRKLLPKILKKLSCKSKTSQKILYCYKDKTSSHHKQEKSQTKKKSDSVIQSFGNFGEVANLKKDSKMFLEEKEENLIFVYFSSTIIYNNHPWYPSAAPCQISNYDNVRINPISYFMSKPIIFGKECMYLQK